jgi:heme A synthase
MISPGAFRWLAAVTALFAYLQITLGGLVRVSGSGLGCRDWPLCDGRPYPPPDVHSVIEYAHRLAGTVTGFLILATVVGAWLLFRRQHRVPLLATAALAAQRRSERHRAGA